MIVWVGGSYDIYTIRILARSCHEWLGSRTIIIYIRLG